jgi:hypothetical protein
MIPVDTTPLRKFISSVYPLKEVEMERFLESWQPVCVQKKNNPDSSGGDGAASLFCTRRGSAGLLRRGS